MTRTEQENLFRYETELISNVIRVMNEKNIYVTITKINEVTKIPFSRLYRNPACKKFVRSKAKNNTCPRNARKPKVKNPFYLQIISSGYGVEVTASKFNKGAMYLSKSGFRYFKTEFTTGGYTARKIKERLEFAPLFTQRSLAMEKLCLNIK